MTAGADLPQMRQVLRGADRDAAVQCAAAWLREQGPMENPVGVIAERFNLSLTAAAGAVLKAREADHGQP